LNLKRSESLLRFSILKPNDQKESEEDVAKILPLLLITTLGYHRSFLRHRLGEPGPLGSPEMLSFLHGGHAPVSQGLKKPGIHSQLQSEPPFESLSALTVGNFWSRDSPTCLSSMSHPKTANSKKCQP
jgi:hypothetical protein